MISVNRQVFLLIYN